MDKQAEGTSGEVSDVLSFGTIVRRMCTVAALLVLTSSTARAQVTRLEITSRDAVAGGQSFGSAGPYVNIRGRVHGEIDPRDRRNRIIQDIDLAPRNARGRVDYVATFSLMMPADLSKSSGVLVYSVVNRGTGAATPGPDGHISLVSGWQGDVAPTATNQTIQVPVARSRNGSPLTGPVLARFSDLPKGTSTAAIRVGSLGTGFYPPATLDTARATLTFHTGETTAGSMSGQGTVPSSEWAFADCRTTPFPGTPDPTRICLAQGFDPARLYDLVYTAKDPLVLGIGFAATRDIVDFFRHAAADANGTANPVAGRVTHGIALGTSQSGNFIKTFVHLGFNEDAAARPVFDGVLPYIAGRQLSMNVRFAAPGGAAGLYEPGSEPALWWGTYKDAERAAQFSEPPGPMPPDADVSEGGRGIRRHGVLGIADVAGSRRYRRETRHRASRQRPPLLHAGNPPWRRSRRFSDRADGQRALLAPSESEPDGRHAPCAGRSIGRVGRERDGTTPEPVSDARGRPACAGGDGRGGVPEDPGRRCA